MFKDKFPYKKMVRHLYDKCREDMDEWQEKFIVAMNNKLECHRDYENVTEKEVREFLSEPEKTKIIETWETVGL